MRFVIYDDETLEPITVMKIRGFTERDIEKHGRRYRIPVRPQLSCMNDMASAVWPQDVELFFEQFRRRKINGQIQESWMCFTKAAELTMLLNPDWLPGQRSAVNYLQDENDRLTRVLMCALFD